MRDSTLGSVMAATTLPSETRPSQSGLPWTWRPWTAAMRSATVGAWITGFSGITETGVRSPRRAETALRTPSTDSPS